VTLWKHQQDAVDRAQIVNDLAIFYDTGTGKTLTMIEILRKIYNAEKQIVPTLILTKLSVVNQWKQEFLKFSKIPADRILALTGEGKKRTMALQKVKEPVIIITNYEAVQIESFYQELKKKGIRIVILDESHSCKDASSKRAKKIYPLCDQAARRFLLTGTPLPNGLLDIFGQYRALDKNIFGDNFYIFRARYFYDKNAGMPAQRHFPDWTPLPDTADKFAKILATTSVQAKKEQCIDLPPLLKIKQEVELGEDQAKAYLEMEKEFITAIGEKVTSAEFAMTKSIRLQQIACGFLVPDEIPGEKRGAPVWFKDVPRLTRFKDTLESIGPSKVIVWTTFQPTYKVLAEIAEKLGRKVCFLTGEQSAKEKQESIDNFCRSGCDTLIAHPEAGGVGVNLTEAAYSIYYYRGYSLTQFLQSEARNFRGGSNMHEKITHYHITAPSTIDGIITLALLDKQNVAEKVLAWARKT
jgi:SNF2 family DNA or RNA helicase